MKDVSDQSNPTLITHRNWSAPFSGGTHNGLTLLDSNLLVMLDVAVLNNAQGGMVNNQTIFASY